MKKHVPTYSLKIKETDLDEFNHVNNATYLIFFEDARWDLISQNGYGLQKIQETNIGPVILEITIKYLKELRLGDEIIIESEITSYKKKIGTMSQKMMRGDELCCTAVFTFALFDLKSRKIVMPTPDWLKGIDL